MIVLSANYFTFRNYSFIEFSENVQFDGIGHTIGVLNKEENDYLFTETVEITGTAIAILFKEFSSPQAREHVRSRAIDRAKARIESGNYKEDGRYVQRITSESLKENRQEPSEEHIRLMILKVLHNIRKNDPSGYKSEQFNVPGFCDLYEINPDQLIYVLSILEEINYIETVDISSGKVFITTKGIDFLKSDGSQIDADGNPIEQKEWDVFISHASEDKPAVVEPLARELSDVHGLKVWYDRWMLKLGDSLRQKIDEGLSFSQYGVVILSPDFFTKGWPKLELDGLFMIEMANGNKKVILPIIHNMTNDQVRGYSPLVASKMSINTKVGIPEIARQVAEVVLNKDIARIYADLKVEHFELNIQYHKINDLSDGEKHIYELVVKAKLNGTPMLKHFRLCLLWPDKIQIKKINDFDRRNRVKIEGQVYRELILEHDSRIYPGQEIEIVGPSCNYQIQYIFNDDIKDYVILNDVFLKYTIFFEESMPCEGEKSFTQLNDF